MRLAECTLGTVLVSLTVIHLVYFTLAKYSAASLISSSGALFATDIMSGDAICGTELWRLLCLKSAICSSM